MPFSPPIFLYFSPLIFGFSSLFSSLIFHFSSFVLNRPAIIFFFTSVVFDANAVVFDVSLFIDALIKPIVSIVLSDGLSVSLFVFISIVFIFLVVDSSIFIHLVVSNILSSFLPFIPHLAMIRRSFSPHIMMNLSILISVSSTSAVSIFSASTSLSS